MLDEKFFAECAEGDVKLVIEFFDGQTTELLLTKDKETEMTKKKEKISGKEGFPIMAK